MLMSATGLSGSVVTLFFAELRRTASLNTCGPPISSVFPALLWIRRYFRYRSRRFLRRYFRNWPRSFLRCNFRNRPVRFLRRDFRYRSCLRSDLWNWSNLRCNFRNWSNFWRNFRDRPDLWRYLGNGPNLWCDFRNGPYFRLSFLLCGSTCLRSHFRNYSTTRFGCVLLIFVCHVISPGEL